LRKDRSTLGNNEHVTNAESKIPNFKKFKAMNECDNFNEILVKKRDELIYGIPFEPKEDDRKTDDDVPVKLEYENNVLIDLDKGMGSTVKCNFSKHGLNLSLDNEMK
jgi:hypothetical protein